MSPEFLIAGGMMVGAMLYALMAGADFGAGVWEFNTALRASPKERRLIYSAIGPVWEANHVWLIFILVALINAFPIAYAALSRALWVPLLLAVVGIVFRGAAYAFRTGADAEQKQLWSAVFAVASTASPFFLGVAVTAIASGRLEVSPDGEFHGSYFTGWVSPLSVFGGFFAVGLCAYLASVYLTREADEAELARIWKRRAIATGFWVGFLAMVGLVLVALTVPYLWEGLRTRAWPLIVLSIVAGLFSMGALWKEKYAAAVLGAQGAVGTVIGGWSIAQFPWLVPESIDIAGARAPDAVLAVMVWVCAIGSVFLIPSFVFLLYLFKAKGQERS